MSQLSRLDHRAHRVWDHEEERLRERGFGFAEGCGFAMAARFDGPTRDASRPDLPGERGGEVAARFDGPTRDASRPDLPGERGGERMLRRLAIRALLRLLFITHATSLSLERSHFSR
jgi:hypothetical protein